MEIPALVQDSLGDEAVARSVALGDDDLVCLTPTRTILYRAQGLLSDEKVEEYPHDLERLDVSEGRRKTSFTMEYVDGKRSFSVPNDSGGQVLELVFEGILRSAGVAGDDESVAGAFLFTELTLVVTDARLVKHIGSTVWTSDFEEYPFADVTGLSFERGRVGTEVVIEVEGHPQRIKTPNEQARKVQKVIESALCEYHDVATLAELNAAVAPDEDDEDGAEADDGEDDAGTDDGGGDLTFGDDIDPLVTDDDESTAPAGDPGDIRTIGPESDDDPDATGAEVATVTESESESPAVADPEDVATTEDLESLEQQVEELRTAVARQNKLLKKQQQTIKQLIKELREGRG